MISLNYQWYWPQNISNQPVTSDPQGRRQWWPGPGDVHCDSAAPGGVLTADLSQAGWSFSRVHYGHLEHDAIWSKGTKVSHMPHEAQFTYKLLESNVPITGTFMRLFTELDNWKRCLHGPFKWFFPAPFCAFHKVAFFSTAYYLIFKNKGFLPCQDNI